MDIWVNASVDRSMNELIDGEMDGWVHGLPASWPGMLGGRKGARGNLISAMGSSSLIARKVLNTDGFVFVLDQSWYVNKMWIDVITIPARYHGGVSWCYHCGPLKQQRLRSSVFIRWLVMRLCPVLPVSICEFQICISDKTTSVYLIFELLMATL